MSEKPKIISNKFWNNQTEENKQLIIESLELAKQKGMNANFCTIHQSLTIAPEPVCLKCNNQEKEFRPCS